jgi:hypothetical protein
MQIFEDLTSNAYIYLATTNACMGGLRNFQQRQSYRPQSRRVLQQLAALYSLIADR